MIKGKNLCSESKIFLLDSGELAVFNFTGMQKNN